MAIKHISFDLWMTLIQSHPEFKIKRSEIIIKDFGLSKTAQEIDRFVRSVDKVFDRYNMISGKKLEANRMYMELLQKLIPDEAISMDKAIEIRNKADQLFLEYQPVFVNKNILDILGILKEKGYSINLSSNTGFIEGTTLRTTLKNMQIFDYFDFLVFSDEINASKPSAYFFKHVHEQTNHKKNEILHIGDNPKADYQGAKNFGFEALLITNSNYSIDDISSKL